MTSFETQNTSDGTLLRGHIWEAESPKAMLNLVHGFGEHSGRYADMAAYLNSRNISVVTLDLRGHGRSDGARGYCPNYNMMLGDVDALLAKGRELSPSLPQCLYGHSMGGGLVLNHQLKALQSNMACVIASAPFIAPAERISGVQRTIVKMLGKIAPKMTLGNKIDGSKISRLPAEQEAYLSDPLNHGKLGVGLAIGMVEGGEWVRDNAERFPKPLLIVHAREDQLTAFAASEAFAAKAPNCTFKPYEDCEHEIHNDCHRADVYKTTADFIESHI
ncbi:alpha/beta hydrolase [Hellea balneolensis]|uniref:alpha/beta hydrolase n=1 Tax=Hellea balneolensis TaxID=287478 RepID=UPI000424A3E9|nr:alpha/beta hydrolase [Hellea balneolensis]